MAHDAHPPSRLTALIAGVFAALIAGILPVRSWEVFHHLAMGRIIARFEAVPTANHLLYSTAEETPAFVPEWLADWALFALHTLYELEGVVTARNLVFALGIGLATAACARRSSAGLTALAAAGVGVLIALPMLVAEPVLLGAPLLALCLVCVGAAARTTTRWVSIACALVVPAVAALWANVDLFFLAPAIVASLGASAAWAHHEDAALRKERAGILGLVTLLALVAPLANPRGPALLAHLARWLTVAPAHPDAAHWASTVSTQPLAAGFVVLVMLLGAGAAIRQRDAFMVHDVGLLAAFGVLALVFERGLVLCAPAAVVALAPAVRMLSERLEREPLRARTVWWKEVAAALLIAPLMALTQPLVVTHAPIASAVSPYELRDKQPHEAVLRADVPVEALELIAQYTVPPRIYHAPHLAGYLEFKMVREEPARVVFSDQRVELVDEKVLEVRQLIETSEHVWRGIFQQYDVSIALLDRRTQSKLVSWLVEHPDWVVALEQGDYVYLARVVQVTTEE